MDRTAHYRQSVIRQQQEEVAIQELLRAHQLHPFYGIRRLAVYLNWSQNKTRRIRTLASVVVPTAAKRYRYRRGGKPEITTPPNILHRYAMFKNESRPQDGMNYAGMTQADAWVQDFTYLKFEQRFCYLAVVLSLQTRQILGWSLGTNHSAELTYAALLDAISKHPAPAILHSDQGSEYLSHRHQLLCQSLEIQLSCSAKSSPWQNGYMETWFGNFKLELPPMHQLHGLAELHEAIALQVYYYNHERIHTSLKMSPAAYAARLTKPLKRIDRLLQKVGA